MFSTAMQAQILCHMHGFSALDFYCNDCLFAAHIWTSFNSILAWFLTSGYPTNKHQCRLFKGWIRRLYSVGDIHSAPWALFVLASSIASTCQFHLKIATRLQLQSCKVIVVHLQLLSFMMSQFQCNHTKIPAAFWCFSGCIMFQMETCQPRQVSPSWFAGLQGAGYTFVHAQLQWCCKCNNACQLPLCFCSCWALWSQLQDNSHHHTK